MSFVATTVPPENEMSPDPELKKPAERLTFLAVNGARTEMLFLAKTVKSRPDMLMLPANLTVFGNVDDDLGLPPPLVSRATLPMVTLLPMPERLMSVGAAFKTPMDSEGARLSAVEITLNDDAVVGVAWRMPHAAAPDPPPFWKETSG